MSHTFFRNTSHRYAQRIRDCQNCNVAQFGYAINHNIFFNFELIDFVTNIINMHRIRKVLESKSNTEDDKVAVLEAQLAQAKQIAEEADRKYEEVQ